MILVHKFSSFLLSAHFTLGLIIASFVAVGLIMFSTSPIGLGPAGMLMAFGVFYIWFLALFMGVAHVVRAVRRAHDEQDERRRFITGRAVVLAASWAFAPLILLALQSIGQLYIASIGLVLLFELLATVYIIRR